MEKTDLVLTLKDRFSEGDIRQLCFDLKIDYEHISGANKAEKALALVIYLDYRNRIEDLYKACLRLRPDVFQENVEHQSTSLSLESPKTLLILFLSADPTNASRLRLGEELREIQEKLQLAKLRENFELHQRTSVRPTDISQALLDVQPRIVHISGHGKSDGALCFEDQIGKIHPIHPEALASLFQQFKDKVHCVILNACYSEPQARAIAKHIDYVIGVNQAIGDKAAINFAIGFYQALGAGRSVEDAYKLGCVQIQLQNIPEHLGPVLIKKG